LALFKGAARLSAVAVFGCTVTVVALMSTQLTALTDTVVGTLPLSQCLMVRAVGLSLLPHPLLIQAVVVAVVAVLPTLLQPYTKKF
jgi:hypothetical protein